AAGAPPSVKACGWPAKKLPGTSPGTVAAGMAAVEAAAVEPARAVPDVARAAATMAVNSCRERAAAVPEVSASPNAGVSVADSALALPAAVSVGAPAAGERMAACALMPCEARLAMAAGSLPGAVMACAPGMVEGVAAGVAVAAWVAPAKLFRFCWGCA